MFIINIIYMNREQINNMSFAELKNELYKCENNPIKEKIIRELMLIRYQQHINTQKQIKKTKKPKKQIKPIQAIEVCSFSDDDFEFDSDDDGDGERNIIEYDKDVTNNNLMDRLHNDMELKKLKPSKSKRDIIKPFATTSGDTYATFKQEPGTHIKSFRNK